MQAEKRDSPAWSLAQRVSSAYLQRGGDMIGLIGPEIAEFVLMAVAAVVVVSLVMIVVGAWRRPRRGGHGTED